MSKAFEAFMGLHQEGMKAEVDRIHSVLFPQVFKKYLGIDVVIPEKPKQEDVEVVKGYLKQMNNKGYVVTPNIRTVSSPGCIEIIDGLKVSDLNGNELEIFEEARKE